MAYDEALAQRIRDEIGPMPDLVEKAMFGGLGFIIGGNMAVSASGSGGMMVRVDPAAGERFLEEEHVEPVVMRGREMTGWLRVDDAALSEAAFATWVARGVDYARSLPPK